MTNEKPSWTLIGEVLVSDEVPTKKEKYAWDPLFSRVTQMFDPACRKIVAQTTKSNLPGIPFVELPPVSYSEEDMQKAKRFGIELTTGAFEMGSFSDFLASLRPKVYEPVMECEYCENMVFHIHCTNRKIATEIKDGD